MTDPHKASPVAVVFDLDDTLIASERARIRSLRRLLGSPVLVRRMADVNAESWRRYMTGEQTLEEHRLGRWATMGIAGADAAHVDAAYRAHYDQIRVRLGARAMLLGLRLRGLGIGLLSNSTQDYVGERLQQLGLAGCFDHVADFQPGRHKPMREVFEAAARVLGASPGETLMVGDLLDVDIPPALEAGYRHAIWMTNKSVPVPAGVTAVRGPRDVLGVVDGLGTNHVSSNFRDFEPA